MSWPCSRVGLPTICNSKVSPTPQGLRCAPLTSLFQSMITSVASSTPSTPIQQALSCGNGSPQNPSSTLVKSALYYLSLLQRLVLADPGRSIHLQIGSVPTPWPSWLIAARPSPSATHTESVRRFLAELTGYVRAFDSAESRHGEGPVFIKQRFGYPEVDIKVSSSAA